MLYSTLQDICYDRYFRPLINGECKLPQKISAKSHWEKEILKRINHTIDAYSTKPAGYEIEIKSFLFGIFYLLFSNDAIIHMHGKTNAVDSLVVAMGISRKGVDFDSLDGKKSQIFFMIISPDNATSSHLQMIND